MDSKVMEYTLDLDLDKPDDFETLLVENRERLERIAWRYADRDDVPDLLQDIAVEAWRSRKTFQGRSSARTWLYRVALNTAFSFCRKRRRTRPLLESDLPRSTGDPINELQLLVEFLDQLDPVNRSILLLYLEGLRPAQIGEVVGLRENAVSVRLTRLKSRFEATYLGDPS